MSQNDLLHFFHNKREKEAVNPIDREKRKKEWLLAIERLYQFVKGSMRDLILDRTVSVKTHPKTMTEDGLGTYKAMELVLTVGGEAVVFSPKGRNIVGTSGRVDLRGDMGEVTLVLGADGKWGIIKQRVPKIKTVPLDSDSLLATLKDIMRP
jgi:hypothetical protein